MVSVRPSWQIWAEKSNVGAVLCKLVRLLHHNPVKIRKAYLVLRAVSFLERDNSQKMYLVV